MELTRRLSFVGLGLTAMVAVGSYWWQLPGLAGSHGIAPLALAMEGLRGDASPLEVPTLLWVSASDGMLHAVCALAFFSALALVFGFAPRWAALTLWASWLSLVQVGQPFLAFQWDTLLVESAFFFAFYAPAGAWPWRGVPSPPGPALRFAMAWLACKVTLGSGLVKLVSGDPTWRDLTALTYHWWTQPLPTWTSVWLAELPLMVQRLLCAFMFVLELAAPLFVLGPRLMRVTGALGLIALQLGLIASGNYAFYNVLTLVLSLPLLDDAVFAWVLGRPGLPMPVTRSPRWHWLLAALVVALGVKAFVRRAVHVAGLDELYGAIARFETVNGYGAFAVMTKTRPEIIVEGTRDGVTWLPYEFPWKPGRVDRRPEFVAPWQPRLDWQLWFAALGSCDQHPWLLETQRHLLLGTPAVLALFAENPFTEAPPVAVRTRVFEYRFAPLREASAWWTRQEKGPYCPAVRLDPSGRLTRAD